MKKEDVKKEIKEEIKKEVKKEVKREVKEEPQSPRPAEARYIKPTGKGKASAAKSKAKPKAKPKQEAASSSGVKREAPPLEANTREPPKKSQPKQGAGETRPRPESTPPPGKGKGTVTKSAPYLSQRSEEWWNKQKKADIIKEVEKLGGFVATTAQKDSFTKADWIRMAKAEGKPDDENNTAQLLKVKVEEGARRSKTKSRK